MIEENNIIDIDEEDFEIKNEQETEQNKKSTYYIYKYTNVNNNKIYIGLCKDPERRQRSHKSAAHKGSKACPLFYNAIRKHGYDSFIFEIIEQVNGPKEADDKEIFWIKELNARDNEKIGYNISIGGGGRGNPNNTDTHKQCPLCLKIKDRLDFYVAINSPDGYRSYCKTCEFLKTKSDKDNLTQEQLDKLNEKRRQKYHSDPEARKRIIEESKRYSANNKEKVSKRQKQWNEDNKEYIQERNRDNYIKNQEDRKEVAKQDRLKIKENNLKLTTEEILLRTPIKHCNCCDKDKESINFYMDMTRLDGLSRLCKDCSKKKTTENRLKKLNKDISSVK